MKLFLPASCPVSRLAEVLTVEVVSKEVDLSEEEETLGVCSGFLVKVRWSDLPRPLVCPVRSVVLLMRMLEGPEGVTELVRDMVGFIATLDFAASV